MTTKHLSLLLDTNVLVDRYVRDRPHAAASHALICEAIKQECTLLYPARAIVDLHYQIGMYYKHLAREDNGALSKEDALACQEIAWSCIDNLCEIATAVGLDESDVWLARKYRSFNHDFEDNFVLAAAERAHADYLVTSDKDLLRKATVAALSPEDMLSYLHARQL